MTRGIVSVALALGLTVGLAQMQSAHAESTGCGLGTTLWEGKSGLFPQILAVTTNDTIASQYFGITSGTLGCDKDAVIASAEVRQLASANLDNLAKDVARGEGETLASFAAAMKVESQDQSLLFATLKSNFTRIFPNNSVSAEDVLVSIHGVMAEDEVLARYVDV